MFSEKNISALIFFPFTAMVVLSPIPFGSIFPWSTTLISTLTAILLLGWVAQASFHHAQPAISLRKTWALLLAPSLVVAWISFQIAPWTPESLHHPLWKSAETILGEKLDSRITLDAHESATALMRILTYCGIFWLALQYGRQHENARRLVLGIAVAGTVCPSSKFLGQLIV